MTSSRREFVVPSNMPLQRRLYAIRACVQYAMDSATHEDLHLATDNRPCEATSHVPPAKNLADDCKPGTSEGS